MAAVSPALSRIEATWPERNSGFSFHDYIKSKHAGNSIIAYYISNHAASGDRDTWVGDCRGARVGAGGTALPSLGNKRRYACCRWEQRICHGQVAVNGVTETNQEKVLWYVHWARAKCQGQCAGTSSARVAAMPLCNAQDGNVPP